MRCHQVLSLFTDAVTTGRLASVGHSLESTPTNGPGSQHSAFPWRSPIEPRPTLLNSDERDSPNSPFTKQLMSCDCIRQATSTSISCIKMHASVRVAISHPQHHNGSDQLSRRVSEKIEEGDIRGAIRLAATDETMAPFNPLTMAALQDKHLAIGRRPPVIGYRSLFLLMM